MNILKLLFRNLWYFRGVNVAVIAGVAVAMTVLTGALMVGDSVRGSLADLALRRLGFVDYALISTRFFDQTLADWLGADQVTPAIIIRGGAMNDSSTGEEKLRTADVQIAALGGNAMDSPGLPLPRGQTLLNAELARSLGVLRPEARVLFSVPTQNDGPRESAMARRGRNDVLNGLGVTVKAIDTNSDFASLFSPNASQRVSRNAWANLQDLQGAIEQEGRVNILLARSKDPHAHADDEVKSLNERLRKVVRLDDYGLSIKPVGNNEASVFARDTYIAPPAIDAAQRAADTLKLPLRRISVNLLNIVTNASGDSNQPPVIHYAVVAGTTSLVDASLANDEIAINQWAADQLHAKTGDLLHVDFSLRKPGGDLTDASKAMTAGELTFKVKTILPMNGLGADPKLPPNYKGLTDAQSVADWDPPEGLTIDKKLVTKADEDYWHAYHAAPKLFVSFETARKLWGGVYGDVTGLRIPAADADRFSQQFLAELKPESMGLMFRPIKAEQLAAASGGTDFAMFFLMFSFFLIVAAGLLVAMLFRLNIEQRARQIGLMSAVGFSPAMLRRLALFEGMILAVVGSVIGLAGAIGYTWLIILGLRTWWIGAVGTTSMTLHITPLSLAYGLVGSLFVAFITILWAVWRVGKAQPARLLAGGWGTSPRPVSQGTWMRGIGAGVVMLGIMLVGLALSGCISSIAGFGAGAMILCGCLGWLGGTLRPRRRSQASFVGTASLARLGFLNASRHTTRAVLSVGLIAFAAFTLITVAALKQNGASDPDNKNSETGGYRLILSAGIPLTGDLNSVQGRHLLGIRSPEDALYTGVHFTPLRQWAGQDISCLNLTKPSSPTILGLPPEMIARGGFVHGETIDGKIPFFTVLDSDQGDAIPVMADSDTQEYVLQIPLGGIIPITDQLGVPRKLKLVATIAHSIFQGQLLMNNANFQKLFPAQSGFGIVLIDMPGVKPGEIADTEKELTRRLSSELDDFAVSVDTTSARLQVYQQVQNTYLETFQTLGALGLMLGTLGLAVVLVRTVIERRSESALLASLGFTSASRIKLVLSENAFLLILGLMLGTCSAVIGILPVVLRQGRPINIMSLAGTLAVVLLIGLMSSAIAVRLAGMHIGPADLRRE